MQKMKNNTHNTSISQQHIEALARCLLPEIEKFFQSEEGQREFEEWKKTQVSEDMRNTAKI